MQEENHKMQEEDFLELTAREGLYLFLQGVVIGVGGMFFAFLLFSL